MQAASWLAAVCAPALLAAATGLHAHKQGLPDNVNHDLFEVSLPAQPLDQALFQFARLTGAQLMFNDGNVARSRAPAVSGAHTTTQLLDALLKGTGYTYRFTGKNTVRVFPLGEGTSNTAARASTSDESMDAPPDAPATGELEEIIVVGSYLTSRVRLGVNPVTVIGRDGLDALGVVTLGEAMRAFASNGAAEFSDENEGPNDARGDVASFNLRELGSANTLVLLNGRRLVTHPMDQEIVGAPTMVVNVNMIPVAAIERVEILRDGASALYGADATAGVVNIVLDDKLEGLRITPRFGFAENTNLYEGSLDLAAGASFNDARSNLSIFGSYFKRNGYLASEQGLTADSDRRSRVAAPWAVGGEFDRRSSRAPFGEFQAGLLDSATGNFVPAHVRRNGANVSNTDGRFHVQPQGFEPQDASVFAHRAGVEVDDGSLPRALYYNINELRGISPETQRLNVLSVLSHDFDADFSLTAELFVYRADSIMQRSPIGLDQELGDIVVPRTNYYNPLGPATSPNRLAGIDAPPSGLDVVIRRYRPLDMGARIVDVDNKTWRGLVSLSGRLGDWRWESALLHTEAHSEDTELNRISKTLFREQLALASLDAFNPFGGDAANSTATLDAVRIAVHRDSEFALRSWDLRLANAAIGRAPGGDIGFAGGIDWRKESYADDRDPRLDGTVHSSDGDPSDVVGVSPTPDSDGSRRTYGAFIELRAPLVGPENALPGVSGLDLQIAGRYEHLDDIHEGVLAPKIGLGWKPIPSLLARATYTEGFQAPNLVVLNQGVLSRLNTGQEDFWRSAVTGLPEDTGVNTRTSIRRGNPDLNPQRSQTYTLGLAFQPTGYRDLALGVDYWGFRQTGIVDNFGVENQLALDYLLRKRGSFNPQVLRLTPTAADIADFATWNAAHPDDQRSPAGVAFEVNDPYLNLQPRTARGVDFSMHYRAPPTALGRFDFTIEATRLLEFDQRNAAFDVLQATLSETNLSAAEAAVILNEIGTAIDPDRIGLNGKPRWKGALLANWRRASWSAGAAVQYVGKFVDTSAHHELTRELWPVDDWLIVSSHLDYQFSSAWLDGLRLRVGVRNLFDEDPPLADEDFGFFRDYHDAKGRFYYLQLSSGF